jgi:hypothetical protein
MTALTRSEHMSYCLYKGEASYYSISAGGDRSVDAVWTYETPFEAVAQMKDYVAFYPEWLAPATHHQSTAPVHLKLVHLQESIEAEGSGGAGVMGPKLRPHR